MFSDAVKRYFTDELLFLCYKFLDRFKVRPRDVNDLFDGLDFESADSDMKRIANALAQLEEGNDGQ